MIRDLARLRVGFGGVVGIVVFVAVCVSGNVLLAQSDAGVVGSGSVELSADAGWTEAGRRCVRRLETMLEVVSPDAGTTGLRAKAINACPKEGLADVSTTSAVERIGDFTGDAIDSEGRGWPVEPILDVVLVLLALGAGAVSYWQLKTWLETAESLRDPAFEVDVHIDKLRRNEELLDEIRGQVRAVGLHRLPQSSSGRYGGTSMEVTYAAFVIDTNDEAHDIAESSDWAEVERHAEWLADELEVPLKDAIYG